ncbi:MAG TPA: preprotein translocase subunit SecG [Candidatus Dormibacteraeota bacterium]|nr:preprotein translocase subunit SecG [Candidatus Dormibacteraeota bacterium]
MKAFFNYLTIISAIIMITSILLQARGSSLGAAFGGAGDFHGSRRGSEKVLYNATIIAATVFVLSVILSILASS